MSKIYNNVFLHGGPKRREEKGKRREGGEGERREGEGRGRPS